MVNEEKTEDVNHINIGIWALMSNYMSASSPIITMKKGGWIRPPKGLVKLSVDASFDQDMLRGTDEVALKYHKGNFVARGNWRIS